MTGDTRARSRSVTESGSRTAPSSSRERSSATARSWRRWPSYPGTCPRGSLAAGNPGSDACRSTPNATCRAATPPSDPDRPATASRRSPRRDHRMARRHPPLRRDRAADHQRHDVAPGGGLLDSLGTVELVVDARGAVRGRLDRDRARGPTPDAELSAFVSS